MGSFGGLAVVAGLEAPRARAVVGFSHIASLGRADVPRGRFFEMEVIMFVSERYDATCFVDECEATVVEEAAYRTRLASLAYIPEERRRKMSSMFCCDCKDG